MKKFGYRLRDPKKLVPAWTCFSSTGMYAWPLNLCDSEANLFCATQSYKCLCSSDTHESWEYTFLLVCCLRLYCTNALPMSVLPVWLNWCTYFLTVLLSDKCLCGTVTLRVLVCYLCNRNRNDFWDRTPWAVYYFYIIVFDRTLRSNMYFCFIFCII